MLGRLIFKKNVDGTFDILDSESTQSIYGVSSDELRMAYDCLTKYYNGLQMRKGVKNTVDLVAYANQVLGGHYDFTSK